MPNYDQLSTVQLVSIWKGFRDGDIRSAATALERRIQAEGKTNLSGPGKVVYLYNKNLRFTILSEFQKCKHPAIFVEGIES